MKALLVAAFALIFAGVASAQTEASVKEGPVADVADTTGEVLINRGDDYVAPEENAPLREGDQVLTKENSTALVRYEDGCDVTVPENTVYTVDQPDDCPAAILALGEPAFVAATGSTVPFIVAGVGAIVLVAIFAGGDDDTNDGVVVSP